jgi:hypothetical protein
MIVAQINLNKVVAQNGICIVLDLKLLCSCEESVKTQENGGIPDLVPTAETFDTADTEVDGPEMEEELGIFQVL